MVMRLGELVKRLRRYRSAAGRWPLEEELPAYLRLTPSEAAALVDELVASGGWERRSGLIMPQIHQEVQEDMPKGIPINWPTDEEFVRITEEAKAKHGDLWATIVAQQFGASAIYVKQRLDRVRARLRDQISAQEPPTENQRTVAPAASAVGEVLEGEMVSPGAPALVAAPGEGPELGWPAPDQPVQTGRLTEEQLLSVFGEEEQADTAALAATLERAVDDQHRASLVTHRTLILIEQPDPQVMPVVRRELEHVARAPEQPGDDWAEPLRVDGRRTYRMWTCVGMVDPATCILFPAGALLRVPSTLERFLEQAASGERGAA
ncbi:MAG: hypothetical protein ACOY93_08545 [Bacillota bacterium]